MNRQPFTTMALKSKLTDNERYHLYKLSPNEIEEFINDSLNIAHENFRAGVSIHKFQLKGRCVYSSSCLKEKLILRHTNFNLKRTKGVFLKQRNTIIEEIKINLKEGTQYRIYRLDIKSFFESIDLDVLISIINNNSDISRHTKNIVKWYLKTCERTFSSKGLPRGLEISPVLSEIYLSEFDKKITKDNDVFYYARFVDDIIIITSGFENENEIINKIQAELPRGLVLNSNEDKKSISPLITKRKQGTQPNGSLVYQFNFLGYSFSVIDTVLTNPRIAHVCYRHVKVDLSPNRLKKIKTRIAKSFYAFKKNGDFKLLLDRISFLTSNRDLKRKIKNTSLVDKLKISTGIYYSNAKLDVNSESLISLDKFLIFCTSSNKHRINKIAKFNLNKNQKKEILRNSFKKGFSERIYRKFNYGRYEEIIKIWL
nr:antiviral reverse transcriptase Drt3a [uncultured Rahnella sp.]